MCVANPYYNSRVPTERHYGRSCEVKPEKHLTVCTVVPHVTPTVLTHVFIQSLISNAMSVPASRSLTAPSVFFHQKQLHFQIIQR